MQKMILVPVEQYNRMIESYDRAMKELQDLREQFKAMKSQEYDVNQELTIYDLMDKRHCDGDVVELLFQDQQEA